MSLPDYLLDLPAEEAARLIALGLLDRTAEAAGRLADPTDPMALHDFRVAARRLANCLRTWRREIGSGLPRGLRRRFARLVRATRRSRDLEVHLAWERAQGSGLTERQRAGLGWHLRRLEARRRRADLRVVRLVERRFARLERRFRRRLAAYRLRIERDPSRRRHEAAAVLGSRIQAVGGDLECRLAAVRRLVDARPSHRARIAAKRLRYLLEPVRSEVDGVEPLIRRLHELQDALGELHDSHTHRRALRRELAAAGHAHERRLDAAVRAPAWDGGADGGDDPRPGLLALAERLEEREAEAYARLRGEWLGGAAEEFFAAVTAVGRRIANRPACVAATERRFVLRRVPSTAHPFATHEIAQGWLPGPRLLERVRPLGPAEQTPSYRSSTLAASTGPFRPAGEVDAALFDEIWPLTAGRRVLKRRYVVPEYGLQWKIDQFLDRDLVIAGVAGSGASPPSLPEWLEPYVVREVTGEREYSDRLLAC